MPTCDECGLAIPAGKAAYVPRVRREGNRMVPTGVASRYCPRCVEAAKAAGVWPK